MTTSSPSLVNLYRFKDIVVVPSAKDLTDIVLSRTQRKTPTEVHKQFKISRIRSFYMRKVKFCQQSFHDKLTDIITQFPKLDEIHPFHSDLCNVLYDRDHYKLALGQCNAVRGVVDNIAKDYVRLMKYADSLYKCKMLKRAALGRMCTAVKKLQQSFAYLEEVRQHLARLPSINPYTRTLILAGYPNVGKSSFINAVSNANVEVQPYAFTTKSLFVGHFDYSYTRWQIIDTPGILDRPLEDRNTVEMTAVTALAHIQATVLFILDVSEQCGFNLESQVKLFHSIKPLFKNKQLLVVLNKTDIRPFQDLSQDEKDLIQSMKDAGSERNVEFTITSTLTLDGVDAAKNRACDLLLESRVTKKAESKRVDSIMNRLFICEPSAPSSRQPFIPPSVLESRQRSQIENRKRKVNEIEEDDDMHQVDDGDEEQMDMELERQEKRKTERELQEEGGGPGVYSVDLRKPYQMTDPSWKYDVIPEIFKGRNIADFIDADIEEKLIELEKEEEQLLEEDSTINYCDSDWMETKRLVRELHSQIQLTRLKSRLKRAGNKPIMPRPKQHKNKLADVTRHLSGLGYSTEKLEQRAITQFPGRKGRRLSVTTTTTDVAMEEDLQTDCGSEEVSKRQTKLAKRARKVELASTVVRKGFRQVRQTKKGLGRIAHSSMATSPNRISLGLHKVKDRLKAEKLKRYGERHRNKLGMKGEADRFIGNLRPKHLLSGKRGIGKTDRR